MKGVVRPQQAPTARKLRTHRHIGGESGTTATGPSGSIGYVDISVYETDRGRYCVSRCTLGHAALPETEPEPLWSEVGCRVGGGTGNDHDDLQYM